jgi:hypothetical protein
MALSPRFLKLAADAKTRIREVSAREANDQQKEGAVLIDVCMDKDGRGWFFPVAGVQLHSAGLGDKPRSELLPKLTMLVKFGHAKAGKLPGALYLCVDDTEQSVVAGTFSAVVESDTPESRR